MSCTRRDVLRTASVLAGAPLLPRVLLASAGKQAPVPHLLLIDDEPLVRRVVGALIAARHGIQVTGCGSGREALGVIAAGSSFTAVLPMPGEPNDMTPRELVRRLRQIAPWVRGVLFAASEEEAVAFRDAGAVATLPRPCRPEELLAAIRGS